MILEELFNGNIFPDELIVPKDLEYPPTCKKIGEEKEYFKALLSEDNLKHFNDLDDLSLRVSSMQSTASFLYGFKLATMIMAEVFTDQEEMGR